MVVVRDFEEFQRVAEGLRTQNPHAVRAAIPPTAHLRRRFTDGASRGPQFRVVMKYRFSRSQLVLKASNNDQTAVFRVDSASGDWKRTEKWLLRVISAMTEGSGSAAAAAPKAPKR